MLVTLQVRVFGVVIGHYFVDEPGSFVGVVVVERQAERLERRLLAKAEHLLAKDGYWRAVELIAAELLRRGSISGRAARHLFDQACAPC